jgi:exosome complex RNA-binding protein Rrp42 (RNase PH superfamily)
MRLAVVERGAALTPSAPAQTPPFRDRPSEGIFNVNVDVGPMASPQAEQGRPSEATVELTRMLERVLKQTGAVDTESLVVQAGRWVWSVRVDINVLDNHGDLACAVSLAVRCFVAVSVVRCRSPQLPCRGAGACGAAHVPPARGDNLA